MKRSEFKRVAIGQPVYTQFSNTYLKGLVIGKNGDCLIIKAAKQDGKFVVRVAGFRSVDLVSVKEQRKKDKELRFEWPEDSPEKKVPQRKKESKGK